MVSSASYLEIQPRFPNEISDRIIDSSHKDRHTLAVCGLVCKAWLPASRYHLFHDFVLKRDEKDGSLHTLEEFTTSSRQTFLKAINSILLNVADLRRGPLLETVCTLAVHEDCLPRHLSLVDVDLRTCSPTHLEGKYTLARRERLHSSFMAGFSSIIELDINNVSFHSEFHLVQFLLSFPVLQRLFISNLATTPSDRIPPPPTDVFLRSLTQVSLESAGCTFLISWLMSTHTEALPLDLLSVAFTFLSDALVYIIELPALPALLKASAGSLQTLKLHQIYHTSLCIAGVTDLSTYQHLRNLEIDLIDRYYTDFDFLLMLLNTCLPKIVTITFRVTLRRLPPIEEWSPVDALLASSCFPQLRQVNLIRQSQWIPMVDLPPDFFPKCHDLGILKII